MHRGLFVICFLLMAGAFALAQRDIPPAAIPPAIKPVAPLPLPPPTPTYLLADVPLVPVRAAAAFLGASANWDAQSATVTLKLDKARMSGSLNRVHGQVNGIDVIYPAPVLGLNGVAHFPARSIAGVFNLIMSYDKKNGRLTLTSSDKKQLVLLTREVPRPASLQQESLAGLTPDDHVAMAVSLWGDPHKVEKDPGDPAVNSLLFFIDDGKSIELLVRTRDDVVDMLHVSIMGTRPLSEINEIDLKKAMSSKGLRLGGQVPAKYMNPKDDFSGDDASVAVQNYSVGGKRLLIAQCITLEDRLTVVAITLAKDEFSKEMLPRYLVKESLSLGEADQAETE